MKCTGIIRRIDDLGRIAIPKEIRRSLGIREGEPLEIYLDDQSLVLKKYQEITVTELLNELEELIVETYDKSISDKLYREREIIETLKHKNISYKGKFKIFPFKEGGMH